MLLFLTRRVDTASPDKAARLARRLFVVARLR